MPRVLLLMTSNTYRAGAFLDAARAAGVAVTVGADRRQALESLHPAGHLTLDFGAPERAAREIAAFAQRHPLDAVLAADDEGAILAALAAETLGLAHAPVAAVRAARSKLATREAFARAGLPTPWFERHPVAGDPAAIARRIEYPCVLKPLFLAASRGVIRADDPAQFAAAFRRIAALLARPEVAAEGGEEARAILVERYIPGIEVALEGLVSAGRLRVLALFDKPDPLEGPFFEETIYVTPSRLPEARQEAVAAMAQRAIAALGLSHGPVHAELRLDERDVWPLEIAPRSIGGLCSRALRFGAEVSLEELILRHALGMSVGSLEREARASGVMMIPIPRAGILRGVAGIEEARRVAGVEDARITIPAGREVVPLPEGNRYLGFLFARADRPEEVEGALREAHRRLSFDIAPAAVAGASQIERGGATE
ncbi:MAG TPA: ATP-grasp domain-containing protein [Candidatus Eisenbacteria bacterium]|jgi:biotin carboxylase